ncbi:MAG: UDP-2,3-diacylglucosamine diphosphatase [Planctomycetota bacterium]
MSALSFDIVVPDCVIVADLHLDGSEPSKQAFASLLDRAHERSKQLFILGDLFHYWFGRRHVEHPMYAAEIELLRQAVDRGLSIEIVPGNRDFLLGPTFVEKTGANVHGDMLSVQIGAEPVHLSHGDLFGTADVRYLRMRRVLRTRMVRFLADHLPAAVLNRIAQRLRNHSDKVVKEKSFDVLEPDLGEVAALFGRGYETVICGHFHRERDERISQELGSGRFLILDPFEHQGRGLVHDGTQWSVESLVG